MLLVSLSDVLGDKKEKKDFCYEDKFESFGCFLALSYTIAEKKMLNCLVVLFDIDMFCMVQHIKIC